MGVCCNGICVLCKAKNRHNLNVISLLYRILLNQQVLSSKTKIMLKMMIELNWKLFVLSFGVIDPTLPGATPLSGCFSSIILKRLKLSS